MNISKTLANLSRKTAQHQYDDLEIGKSKLKYNKLVSKNYESALAHIWKAQEDAPYLGIKDGGSMNYASVPDPNVEYDDYLAHLRVEKIKEFHDFFKSEKEKHALHELLSLLVHGEAYALYTSSTLVSFGETQEARLGFSIQAMEEAKHYYVLRLIVEKLYGHVLPLKPWSRILFDRIANQDSYAKLFGMNIVLENFALMLFEAFEKYPVLSDVMPGFHADESRHCGLPMNYADAGLIPKGQRSIPNRLLRTYVVSPALGVIGEYFMDLVRVGVDPLDAGEKFLHKVINLTDRSNMPLLLEKGVANNSIGAGFKVLRVLNDRLIKRAKQKKSLSRT